MIAGKPTEVSCNWTGNKTYPETDLDSESLFIETCVCTDIREFKHFSVREPKDANTFCCQAFFVLFPEINIMVKYTDLTIRQSSLEAQTAVGVHVRATGAEEADFPLPLFPGIHLLATISLSVRRKIVNTRAAAFGWKQVRIRGFFPPSHLLPYPTLHPSITHLLFRILRP